MAKIFRSTGQNDQQHLNEEENPRSRRSLRMSDFLQQEAQENNTQTEEEEEQDQEQNNQLDYETAAPSAPPSENEEEETEQEHLANEDQLQELLDESQNSEEGEAEENTEADIETAQEDGLVLQGEFINKYLEAVQKPAQLQDIKLEAWASQIGLDGGVPAALTELSKAANEYEQKEDYEGLLAQLSLMHQATDKALQGIQQLRPQVQGPKLEALKQYEDNLKSLAQTTEERQNVLRGIFEEAQTYVQMFGVIRNKPVMSVFLHHSMEFGEKGFSPYFRLIRAVEKKMDAEKIFYGCIMNKRRAEGARKKGKKKSPTPDKIELPNKLVRQLWEQYTTDPEGMDFKLVYKFARTAIRRKSLKDFLNNPENGLFHKKSIFERLQNSPMPDFKKFLKFRS